MKKLLTICLLSLGLSTAAIATEDTKNGANWLNQNQIVSVETASTEVTNEKTIEITEGKDFQEAVTLGVEAVKAANSGKYQIALGAMLMLLIWGLRTFWCTLPGPALPWITAGIAIIGSGAVGMMSGWGWEKIFLDALTVSTSAGGLWSLLGKHLQAFGQKISIK